MSDQDRMYVLNEDVTIRERGEKVDLVAEENVVSLNTTGTEILTLIDNGHSLEEIYDSLAERYETPRSEIESDVDDFVQKMKEFGFVTHSDQS